MKQETDTIKADGKKYSDLFLFSVPCRMEISPIFEAVWRFASVKPYFKLLACLSNIYLLETNTQC